MFRSGEVWRHISCTEMDVYFVKIQYETSNYIKAKVLYQNRQAFLKKNILLDPKPETIMIRREDFHNWVRV